MMRLLFLFLFLFNAASGREEIQLFRSEIKVNDDGWLDVTETIRVKAEGDLIQRGIFRDFPQAYKLKWGFKQIRPFEVLEVKRNGDHEPFVIQRKRFGTRVRIGSEDYRLPYGQIQEYVIRYRTHLQLITAVDGSDELYWNVTGNEWGFPILKIEGRVEVPEGIEIDRGFAWTGAFGEQGKDAKSEVAGNVVTSICEEVMWPGEGMTMVVRWPTGHLAAAAYEKPGLIKGNEVLIAGMVFVVLGLAYYLVMWLAVGRDPPKGVIVPQWNPPEGFTPGGVRYLRNLVFDEKCFSAGILGLAAEGRLKITGDEQPESLVKEGIEVPESKERVARILRRRLFDQGGRIDLDGSDYSRMSKALEAFAQALERRVDKSYFLANVRFWLPGLILGFVGVLCMLLASFQGGSAFLSAIFLVIAGFLTLGRMSEMVLAIRTRGWRGFKGSMPGGLAAFGFWGLSVFLFFYNAGGWAGVSYLIVYFAGFTFQHLIKRPTEKGRRIMDEIEGFREYLRVAEEERLNLENPPEKTPELFDRFLPFAIALDVEQEWSEKFDGVLKEASRRDDEGEVVAPYRPNYFSQGVGSTSFSVTSVAMTGALTSALTTAAMAPTTTGSSGGGGGYSGFSGGGGYSGGGGGGGGGGGW
ncbi:MAG: DUF2207 domain-containing protein [Akkermansiaceae bacterium]